MAKATKTQVVKFIRAGEQGTPGATLRGPQAWSDLAIGYEFQAGKPGDQFIDVVYYGSNCYYCQKRHFRTRENYPGGSIDQANHIWKLGDHMDLVATKILFATYAVVKNLGVEAIEMKNQAGQIMFEAKDGKVTCNTGNFENVSISGNLNVANLTYQSNKFKRNSAGQNIVDCSFILGGGSYIMPHLVYGEVKRITVWAPIVTKSDEPAYLTCEGSNDRFIQSGEEITNTSRMLFAQGWVELVGVGQGFGDAGTIWMFKDFGLKGL